MTPAELADQWAAALDGVTPGPWFLDSPIHIVQERANICTVEDGGTLAGESQANARFIAQARNLADETVAALRRCERLIKAVEMVSDEVPSDEWIGRAVASRLREATTQARGDR